jgi:hypothetical protein
MMWSSIDTVLNWWRWWRTFAVRISRRRTIVQGHDSRLNLPNYSFWTNRTYVRRRESCLYIMGPNYSGLAIVGKLDAVLSHPAGRVLAGALSVIHAYVMLARLSPYGSILLTFYCWRSYTALGELFCIMEKNGNEWYSTCDTLPAEFKRSSLETTYVIWVKYRWSVLCFYFTT